MALRPEVGTQPQFRKRKPPATYRYDSSLSPSLEWDGKNPVREQGEWLLALIDEAAKLPAPQEFDQPRIFRRDDGTAMATCRGLRDAIDQLKRLGKPFLNWAGKAERLSFDVPTLPLFVHERLSTMAIVETLKDHTKEARGPQLGMFDLFGDPQRPIADQVLKAYEYRDKWVNRMILGDSLVVMNSLLHYEGLGGQVQMVYIDPPYGVKFGSNFQSFVRSRDVDHNHDEDMTREPEMVKAYRDTWEFGVHSWMTYLHDRLLLSRDLLESNGSIFVQISDDNLHHVIEVMDEIFGEKNRCGLIAFRTTGGQSSALLSSSTDFLVWYAKDKELARKKFHNPLIPKTGGADDGSGQYVFVEPRDFSTDPRPMTDEELEGAAIPDGWRVLAHDTLYSQGAPSDPDDVRFEWRERTFACSPNTHWKPGVKSGGMQRLSDANRLMLIGNTLRYKRYVEDSPIYMLDNVWNDTAISGFGRKKRYVVETSTKVIERCVLMTTSPGELVFDPTCGSGTTAYVAEKWGRRWITTDTSRVPLALARERVITATFAYYTLKDEDRGPAGGFVYSRRQNRKGEEVGGIIPHITLGSIANSEPPGERVVSDRPDETRNITRVSGPFCVEATIPTPVDWDQQDDTSGETEDDDTGSFVDRMLEILRRSPVLQLGAGKTVALRNVRPPTKSLSLSAEAVVENGSEKPIALVFGPENGAISETLVFEAAREAHGKSYTHLYVIGFAIQPNARQLVKDCESAIGIAATYVQATPDLMMGDLLKTMRSSQIFSVCGMPDVRLEKLPTEVTRQPARYQVSLRGLDTFDPITMEPHHLKGDDVPAWLLDTDYNGLVFHGSQVFFPRTSAWDNLKKALSVTHDPSVWAHLAGVVSAPFEAGEHQRIAVKVIDDRGNELIVVKPISEAV
jgi:adenine-specific DNA-methyltransferase